MKYWQKDIKIAQLGKKEITLSKLSFEDKACADAETAVAKEELFFFFCTELIKMPQG